MTNNNDNKPINANPPLSAYTTKAQLFKAVSGDIKPMIEANCEKEAAILSKTRERGSLEKSNDIEKKANEYTKENMLLTAKIINKSLKKMDIAELKAKDLKELAVINAISYDKNKDYIAEKVGKYNQKTAEQLEFMKKALLKQIKSGVVKVVLTQTEKTAEITGENQ